MRADWKDGKKVANSAVHSVGQRVHGWVGQWVEMRADWKAGKKVANSAVHSVGQRVLGWVVR